MANLAARMLGEVLVALVAAGIVIGLSIPPLLRYHVIAAGDLSGRVVIGSILIASVVAMLLRKGSALNRHRSKGMKERTNI